MELKIIYNKPLILGEGPIWDIRTQRLYFVDILDRKLFAYDYESELSKIYQFEEFVSCVALTSNPEEILIALESGIYRFDLNQEEKVLVSQPETKDNFRFNDGAVTPWGSWLLGSMNNLNNGENAPLLPDATLYEIKKDKTYPILNMVTISNGIVFEDSYVYFIDSVKNSVRRFKYINGNLENETLIFQFNGSGSLDGMCLSESRKLYIANWAGYQIIVFDLKTESVINYIPVPAKNPTSCTFGGPKMNQLFISTSNNGEDKPEEISGIYSIELEDLGFEEPILNW